METQRLEAAERQLARLERRMRGAVAGWILSIIVVLVFGLIAGSALSGAATSPVVTVHGIKVVDDQGRVRASIDGQGVIRGGEINGSWLRVSEGLAIGISPKEWFSISTFAVPHGHAIAKLEMVSPETGSSVFSVWTSASATDTRVGLQQGNPAKYVHMTLAGIEGGRGVRPVWHVP